MVDMLNEEEPSYKRRLIEALAELSTDEWKLLENITLIGRKKGLVFYSSPKYLFTILV